MNSEDTANQYRYNELAFGRCQPSAHAGYRKLQRPTCATTRFWPIPADMQQLVTHRPVQVTPKHIYQAGHALASHTGSRQALLRLGVCSAQHVPVDFSSSKGQVLDYILCTAAAVWHKKHSCHITTCPVYWVTAAQLLLAVHASTAASFRVSIIRDWCNNSR